MRKGEEGEVSGVLFDRPQLIILTREHPEQDVAVSRASYQPQSYGFALPLDTKTASRRPERTGTRVARQGRGPPS
jgi:ABC-type amino acid transport substrate-binding protein